MIDVDEKENINIRAAFVHAIGDLLQSVGVIIAAIVILIKPEWKIVDPICTFIFSFLTLATTTPVFKDCFRILMGCVPNDVRTNLIRKDILLIDGV